MLKTLFAKSQRTAPMHAAEVMSGASRALPDADETALVIGLLSGTRVATEAGWRPVDALRVGDAVLTFDAGPQIIQSFSRRRYPGGPRGYSQGGALIHVPAGVIGNRAALHLLPGQAVMVESDLAEHVYGDPFVLVPAEALTILPGVTARLPDADVMVVTLAFEEEQLVFAEGQALTLCSGGPRLQSGTLDAEIWPEDVARYPVLTAAEAGLIVAGLAEATATPGWGQQAVSCAS